MFIELDKSINTLVDLENYFKKNNIHLPEYKCAVIALILDNDEKILLQRRGPKSRDEVGKLEDIGGAVENYDLTFKDAMNRELREEAGDKIKYQIDELIGGCLINKFNSRTGIYVNWLFLLYKCSYIEGEFICNEDGKSLGYEWYKYDELPLEEIADSTKSFWEFYYNKKDSF